MSLRRLLPVAGDAGLLASARMLAYAVGTITPIVLARRLAVDDLGGYRDLLLISFTCMQVLQLGLPHSLYYFLPSRMDQRWTAVTHSLLVLSAVGGVLAIGFAASGPLLADLFQLPRLSGLAPAIGAFVAGMVLTTLLDALLIADGRVRLASLLALGTEVFRSLLLLAVALVAPTLEWITLVLLIVALVRVVILAWVARPYTRLGTWLNGRMARAQFAFAGPFAVSLALAAAAATVDKYLVSSMYGPAVFAIYALGLTQVPLVDILFSTQSEVVLARMKVSRDSGDVEAILAVWLDMVRRMALFVLPAFALLLVIGNQLMVTLYGQRYAESGLVFTIFVFHLLRYVAPYGVIPRVYGETVFILRVSLFALLATVVALFVCTYLWGYVGAAVANVLSVYFISWPQVVKSNRLLGVHPSRFLPWAALARVSGVSALAAVALLAVRPLLRGPEWLQLLGMCGLFGGLYLGGLVISGELKRTRV